MEQQKSSLYLFLLLAEYRLEGASLICSGKVSQVYSNIRLLGCIYSIFQCAVDFNAQRKQRQYLEL